MDRDRDTVIGKPHVEKTEAENGWNESLLPAGLPWPLTEHFPFTVAFRTGLKASELHSFFLPES